MSAEKADIGLIGLAVMGQVCARSCRRDLPCLLSTFASCELSTRPGTHCASRLQNLALNIAEKGFSISVSNRSNEKVDACESRAKKAGARSLPALALPRTMVLAAP